MNLYDQQSIHVSAAPEAAGTLAGWGRSAERVGAFLLRYGLVVVLVWIGGMKFTAYEAEGIRPFVENSPLFAWTYGAFGVRGTSGAIGVVEIALGLLIAAGPWLPKVAAVGGLLASGMFLSTLSFLVTTPAAWVAEGAGFPAIAVTGQFLLKDLCLLGAALWTAGEALSSPVAAGRLLAPMPPRH